ncbi:hypothetical protein ACFL0K_01475 [Patescibacteria group bacterium]
MSETAYYTKKNLIIAFIIGLIVGFGSYYVWDTAPFQSSDDEKKTEEVVGDKNDMVGDNLQDPSSTITSGINTITIGGQPAGLRVVLDSASFSASTWVAVREDLGGELGNILGASRFDVGDYTNAEIDLLRNTSEGSKYHVVMYKDDGDKEFDHKKDVLVEGSNGVVKYTFSAIRIK